MSDTPGSGLPSRISRVLLVDDEPVNVQLLRVMLTPEGYDLDTAANGEEALLAVKANPPDLILLDIMMPAMDGYEVVRRLKTDPATVSIPIVLLTSLDDRKSRLKGLTAGAESFLSKPIERAELIVRVRNLLRLKAYADYHDSYSQMLETEVGVRTEALRVERDRAQRYLDTAEVMLIALDPEGRITLANRYACSLLGWTAEELAGRDWIDTCFPLRHRQSTRARFQRFVSGDIPVFDARIVTKGGAERTIEWRTSVFRDRDCKVTGTLSSGTDVTDRNRTARALRTAEERMRFALQSANIGIWDADLATGDVEWSDVLEAQYGLVAGSFPRTFDAFAAMIHPEDRADALAIIGQATVTGTDFSVDHRVVRPNGVIRSLSGSGRVVMDAHGKAIRAVGISLDVTDRRLLEQQFLQAQKMEAVGRLAAGVAHDFNNLLSVILGWSGMAESEVPAGHPVREALDEINKAGQGAVLLTKQLLAFSRQQIVLTTLFNPNGLVRETDRMLRRVIGSNVQLVIRTDPHVGSLKMDRGQLEQVLVNFVMNARDAMPDGGRVTIATSNVTIDRPPGAGAPDIPPGEYVLMSVGDRGTGMTDEVKAKMFEPFFTTKGPEKGTGLGLATSQGIIQQAGGHIRVESEVGVGTTMQVYLPRSSSAAAVIEEPDPDEMRGVESILLVEDEPAVLLVARTMLESLGYHVITAKDASEALELVNGGSLGFSLLVTDIVLGNGRNGWELAEAIRASRPDTRVLYFSGFTGNPEIREKVVANHTSVVQKPITLEVFGAKVREALDAP